MKPGINSIHESAQPTAFSTAQKIKRPLLLALGTLVPCGAALTYSVLQVEASDDTDLQKISLLFSAVALPIYLIVLLLKESLDTKRDRKKITAMVTELTESITGDKESLPGTPAQRSPRNTDALVRKIVKVINA